MFALYAILAIVMNPVGRALRLRGNGAAVVRSFAAAVSSSPVAVGTGELVEVLVGGGHAKEGGSEDSLGKHLDGWDSGWKSGGRICTAIDSSDA